MFEHHPGSGVDGVSRMIYRGQLGFHLANRFHVCLPDAALGEPIVPMNWAVVINK